MNAPLPTPIIEESPLKPLAEKQFPTPGMYLIALRAHVNKGQKWVTDRVETLKNGLFMKDPFVNPAPDQDADTQAPS